MSARQRNSSASKAWLAKMEAEGQARATRKAQERVVGAVHLQTQAGVTPFEAAANAIAAETGRPIGEARAWLKLQVERQKAINAIARPPPPPKRPWWRRIFGW